MRIINREMMEQFLFHCSVKHESHQGYDPLNLLDYLVRKYHVHIQDMFVKLTYCVADCRESQRSYHYLISWLQLDTQYTSTIIRCLSPYTNFGLVIEYFQKISVTCVFHLL